MSLSGISGVPDTASAYSTSTSTVKKANAATDASTTEEAAVYEKSSATEVTPKTYAPNTELIAKLKADADAKTEQLRSIVEKLIQGQGKALGTADEMWSFLASGDYTVDAATKSQAQADIAADGYWGVEQTSNRILDFAKALSGGDPAKAEELRAAFKKGFEQATKTWGKDLPSISSDTYDSVMKKFDAWAAEASAATVS